jgi:CDP-diacylglycerol--serine O-phosphatidyltransferase
VALLFATSCALRLARFNTELEEPDHSGWRSRFFTGLPAPAAAGCLIMPVLASFALGQAWPQNWMLNAAVTVVVALLMVSRVPTFSIKMIVVRVKPEWILPTLIGVGLLVAALSSAPWMTLLAIGVVYLVSLPISIVVGYRLQRQHARAGAPATPARAKPEQAPDPSRIVPLGSGAKPTKRDAS